MRYLIMLSLLFSVNLIAQQSQSLSSHRSQLTRFLNARALQAEAAIRQGNPNQQDLSFQNMVEKTEEILDSKEVLSLIENSHTLKQYHNLMKNHLLHIQLTNEIESFQNLSYMYPHEMPF
ncbi:MAG: hypothetical protein VX642_05115, partial [Bdellovibrionota bacterium]|nr:hypothetical protein [Bdellovibrionota bacterium]